MAFGRRPLRPNGYRSCRIRGGYCVSIHGLCGDSAEQGLEIARWSQLDRHIKKTGHDPLAFGLWQTPTLFGQQSNQSAEDELRMLCSTFGLTMLSCDIIRNSCRSTILWKLSQGTDWLKRCLHRPVAALAKGSPIPDIPDRYGQIIRYFYFRLCHML